GKSPRILQGPKSDRKELDRLGKALRNWESCEITTLNYKKNGEEFWINFTVSPVADKNGWYTHWIAIERDVTEVKNEQLKKELISQIGDVFNLTTDLYQTLQELTKLVVSIGNFSFSEIWLHSNQKNKLRLFSSYASTREGEQFYSYSNKLLETDFGQGLQGLVWKANSPLLWDTTKIKNIFLRNEASKKAAINSVLGIPLIGQEAQVGVLLLGSTQDENFLKKFEPVLTELGIFIGTEIKRKRLESDLHHLFEALPDLICLATFDGTFLKINKAGCDLLGYQEEELLGANFNQFVHPEDIDISAKAIQQLQEGETIFKFENRYITKKGKTLWLNWNCNCIPEEGVMYATAIDITDEKKLREVVSNASELATIGGWEIDLTTDKLTWSDIIYTIYETTPDVYTPELSSAIAFFREDFRDQVAATVQNAINKGAPFEFEAALITFKGNEKWVKAIAKPEIVNGICVRIFGSFQDITKIKETEHRLQSITNDLPGVTFQYYMYPDRTDAMVSVSEASHKIWGLSPE
ncbi:PAS domain S-box protein, partial [uncultured Planktosalinus sp.]|uniref:PAS domain S-box protein n=1 Tax=uncultured Planktosalinus sp. TaxID=1810935 RepID=UPI0030D86D6A